MRDRDGAGKSASKIERQRERERERQKEGATTCSKHLLQEKRDKFKRTTDKRQLGSMRKRNATKEREGKCLSEGEQA